MNVRILTIACSCLIVFAGQAGAQAPLIRFGAMAELSGPGAMNGAACQLGYRIAEHLFQEKHPDKATAIEVVYGDHKREQKTAIAEFQRFSQLGVWAVVANHGIIGAVINPISRDLRLPLFGVMGHENFVKINPYAVRIIPTPQEEGGGLARKAFARGARKAAMLILEDDYILAVGAAFKKVFEELGGQVVYKDYIVESISDFSTIATRIRSSQPDVIAMTLGFQQFGPAIRRLREQGVGQPIYANYWLSYPAVVADAGGAASVEGSVYITERSDYPVFLRGYESLSPQGFRSGVVFRCYTALAAGLAALLTDPEIQSREQYAAQIRNLSKLQLPDRVLTVKDQEAQFEMEYYTFRNGERVLLP